MEVLEKRQKEIRYQEGGTGFARLDMAEVIAEVITTLNQLWADYEIHCQKLRNFHWNVVGKNFFDPAAKFGEFHIDDHVEIDEIIEWSRIFDKRPYSTFHEFLTNGSIKRINKELIEREMVNESLNDFHYLIQDIAQVISMAQSTDDIGTEDLMVNFLKYLEK